MLTLAMGSTQNPASVAGNTQPVFPDSYFAGSQKLHPWSLIPIFHSLASVAYVQWNSADTTITTKAVFADNGLNYRTLILTGTCMEDSSSPAPAVLQALTPDNPTRDMKGTILL